jgi:hypothetical protein
LTEWQGEGKRMELQIKRRECSGKGRDENVVAKGVKRME